MSFDCLICLTGSNWILHIINELIFADSKKKYEYPEFPVLECGDPEKYQVSTKPECLASPLEMMLTFVLLSNFF